MYETISEGIISTVSAAAVVGEGSSDQVEVSRMTIRDFEARIRRYNSDLGSDSVTFRAAVILLAGLEYGHNIDRIARRTGYDRPFVARVARRLTDNGVWNAGVTVADWSSDDEASGTFWNDVAVAEGKMCRRIGPTGQIEWAPAGFWNKSFLFVDPDAQQSVSAFYHDAGPGTAGAGSGDSADNRDDAMLIGDAAAEDELETALAALSSSRPEVVETEIVGPGPGTSVFMSAPSGSTTVPPLEDLFRDVVWIG